MPIAIAVLPITRIFYYMNASWCRTHRVIYGEAIFATFQETILQEMEIEII